MPVLVSYIQFFLVKIVLSFGDHIAVKQYSLEEVDEFFVVGRVTLLVAHDLFHKWKKLESSRIATLAEFDKVKVFDIYELVGSVKRVIRNEVELNESLVVK